MCVCVCVLCILCEYVGILRDAWCVSCLCVCVCVVCILCECVGIVA